MTKSAKLAIFILPLIVTACGGSDGDADLAPLPPLITFPVSNTTVSGLVDVRVDLDRETDVERLSLLVNGVEVATDSDEPYSLTWNTYFDLESSDASLVVKASTDDGDVLRSDILTVKIGQPQDNSSLIWLNDLPSDNPNLSFPYGTEELAISWSPVAGADQYEYQVGDSGETSTDCAEATISLTEGVNTLRIRAADGDRWGPWVELPAITVQAPQNPSLESTINEDGSITVVADLEASTMFSSVSLVVNGETVATSQESPYTFTWDPYFWGVEAPTQYQVQAELEDGRSFQSEQVVVDPEAVQIENRIMVTLPEGSPTYMGVDSLGVSWTNVAGAVLYEYELDGTIGTVEHASIALDELQPGDHQFRVRAVDSSGRQGAWSPHAAFEIGLPAAPELALPEDSTTFFNVESVIVTWAAVDSAGSYQYRTSDDWVETNDTAATIFTPTTGLYTVDVRSLDALGRAGPANQISFENAPPKLPSIDSPAIEWVDGQFEVTITWEDQGEGNQYQIAWSDTADIYETTTNSITIAVTAAGEYPWSFKRITSEGHSTDWAAQSEIPVGIFRTQLGGSRSEYGSALLRSSQGGYIVVATTLSRELEPSISTGAAPWVIRLDESGVKLDDLVLTPSDRISDAYEDSDGNIFLSGDNSESTSGFVYKISKTFEVIWRETFSATNSTDRYLVRGITSWNSQVAAVGYTQGRYEVLLLDPDNGALVDFHEILATEPLLLEHIAHIDVSPAGELVMSGMGHTSVDKAGDFYDMRAFIYYLDADFNRTATWHAPTSTFERVDNTIFTADGDLAITGYGFSGGSTVAVVDGTDLSQIAIKPENRYLITGDTRPDRGNSGGLQTLLMDTAYYPHRMVLVEFDGNLFEVERATLLDESHRRVAPAAVVSNPDDSTTILFAEVQDDYQYDIVIKRFLPEAD